MNRTPLVVLIALASCALLLPAAPVQAQVRSLPKLGAPVPDFVTAEKHKECSTGPGHKDPCAEIDIEKIRYIVGWDAQTKAVTWLFTDDRRLVTDTQLAVGNSCHLVQDSGAHDSTVPYLKWIIDPRWKGPATSLTGNAIWYAALQKQPFDDTYGSIVGFVQSAYLPVKP
ncbi:MAG TPA: hypothetical protein VME68_10585 [Acidobacteriaceae bacterium]|nr:hypothetical protein [Acidobacteriaceae bacterium]